MKKYVKDMTEGTPVKLILSFMIPMLLGNIFQQFYSMVDSIIVGQFIGADALAAVGATGSMNFLIFSLCVGMSNGIGIVVSQFFGAGREERVRRAIANAAYIMIVAAVVMGTIGVVFARPILTFLDTPSDIIDQSVIYMVIMCAGIPCVSLYNCVSAILRGVGDSKTPLYFLVVSSILNIGLDLLFVCVYDKGVAGAGIATVISQLSAGVGSLIFALYKNPFFKIEKEQRKIDKSIIKQCVRLGVPLAFQTSLIAISCVALQRVVNSFGPVVMAAFTATSRIEMLYQQPLNSVTAAVSTFSGQNLGAGKLNRVKKGFLTGMTIMGIFTLVVMPLAYFFGNYMVALFVKEQEVIEIGARAMKITCFFYLALGTIYVTRGLLNGCGDATYSFLSGICEMLGRICFAGPLTSIAAIGKWGIWWATALTWFLCGSLGMIRFLQGKWKRTESIKIETTDSGTEET